MLRRHIFQQFNRYDSPVLVQRHTRSKLGQKLLKCPRYKFCHLSLLTPCYDSQIRHYFVPPKLSLLFQAFYAFFNNWYSFANSAVSFLNCIRIGRQYLTEESLGFCQRIILSLDIFVEYNYRGTTDVIKISLLLTPSSDRCLYSLCPVLPSQSHFEMRTNSFEVSSRTIWHFFEPW
jgi:hypothetical protein